MKRLYSKIGDLYWGNPLLARRLSRGTVYTLENFLLLVVVALTWFGAWLRWRLYARASEMVESYPSDFEGDIRELLAIPETAVLHLGLRPASFGYPVKSEMVSWFSGLCAFGVLFGLLILRCVPWSSLFRRQRTPFGEQLLATPITPTQVFVAKLEWPFIKISLVILLCLISYLMPSRSIGHDYPSYPQFLNGIDPLPLTTNATMILIAAITWAIIFTLHRFTLVLWLCRGRRVFWWYLRTYIPILLVVAVILCMAIWSELDWDDVTLPILALIVLAPLIPPFVASFWVAPHLLERSVE